MVGSVSIFILHQELLQHRITPLALLHYGHNICVMFQACNCSPSLLLRLLVSVICLLLLMWLLRSAASCFKMIIMNFIAAIIIYMILYYYTIFY